MTPNTVFMPNGDGSHTMLVGASGSGKSILEDLTSPERTAMNEWAAEQHAAQAPGSALDMMKWPGWGAVAERKLIALGKAKI